MDVSQATRTEPQTRAPRPTPPDSPMTREQAQASEWHRDLSTAKIGPGDPAFDFTLPVLDPIRGLTGQTVRLSDHAGRLPVALIFGSYT